MERKGCLETGLSFEIHKMPRKGKHLMRSELVGLLVDLKESSATPTMHNVYMRDCDSPVYKIALYMLQGNNFFGRVGVIIFSCPKTALEKAS